MKQTLEEAVNEIGGVHPDWDKITCFRIGFKEGTTSVGISERTVAG